MASIFAEMSIHSFKQTYFLKMFSFSSLKVFVPVLKDSTLQQLGPLGVTFID